MFANFSTIILNHIRPICKAFKTNEITATSSKSIFFVCLFFYLLLGSYGIYYAELRMQFEGAEDTILTCLGRFRIPFYRYAYILNKYLFVLSLKLHLSFKFATAVYSLNDTLFYLGIALLIVFFTSRYDYASTILAAPLLLHDSLFYFIANEIFLSGSIMVFYTAIHIHMKQSRLKYILLAVSIFFIVWSHPVMLLVLAIFFPFLYPSPDTIKQNKKMITFLGVNVIARLMLFSNYDQYKVNQMDGAWFEPNFWMVLPVDYYHQYGYLILIIAIAIVSFGHSKNKIGYSGLLFLPVLIACCNASKAPVGHQYFLKFLYPAHLFILLHAVKWLYGLPVKYVTWAAAAVFFLLFTGGRHLIESHHNIAHERTLITQRLNTLCSRQDSSHSKWYIIQDSLRLPSLFYTDQCHESLFYSEYQNQPLNTQLAQIKSDEKILLDTLGEDMLLANMRVSYSISQLDTCHFNISSGKYKELMLDSAKRDFLMKGIAGSYKR